MRDTEASESREMPISTGLHRGWQRFILCLKELWVFGRGVCGIRMERMLVGLISWRKATLSIQDCGKGRMIRGWRKQSHLGRSVMGT